MQPLIDNISEHETPEGLVLNLMPAGIMPRLSAWIIDIVIRSLLMIVGYILLFFLQKTGQGLILILFFLLNWLYSVYFEVYHQGMTPGKKRCGIYVCHDDGTPVTLQSSMIRNLLRVADFLPMAFMGAIVSMMFNKKSQRIGDLVAGTVVVYREQNDIAKVYKKLLGKEIKQSGAQSNDAFITQMQQNDKQQYDAKSMLFTQSFNLKEQQSLLSLSERLVFLPQTRRQEITDHLSPLVKLQHGQIVNDRSKMVYYAVVHKTVLLKGNE